MADHTLTLFAGDTMAITVSPGTPPDPVPQAADVLPPASDPAVDPGPGIVSTDSVASVGAG